MGQDIISAARQEASPSGLSTLTRRRDIQGIRAYAVVVVFLDHLVGWPSGGFSAVDMFFVVSGFVITAGLLRQYERTGHISARAFYIRRIKRIIPAATLVLIVTTAMSFVVFTRQRALDTVHDAVAAFLFFANWNFASNGTDYFQQGSAISPLQHYWSLSVEEQFYFVWPWLLLGLLVLVAKLGTMTPRRMRLVAGGSVSVLIAASLGWSLIQAVTSPTVAYFSTFTRAWELGIGALLAVVAPLFSRTPAAVRTLMAYVGLLGMTIGCFIITPTTVWPAPWALIPTLSTALVIASGIGAEARHIWPLTNRMSVYIGDISYSLYLWHFPAIVFGMALFPDAGPVTYLGIVIAGLGLAIAAYHAVERPLWKSPLWEASGQSPWKEWRFQHSAPARDGGLVCLGVATATVAALALTSAASARAVPVAAPAAAATSSGEPATALDAAAREVIAALGATRWGDYTPALGEVGPETKAAAWVEDGCLALERGAEADPKLTAERCVYGTGDKVAVVYGDSFGISWFPAVQEALGDGWTIHVLTMQQCPASPVTVHAGQDTLFPECADYQTWARGEISRLAPDLTVVGQADNTLIRLEPEQPLGPAGEAVRDAFVTSLTAISAASAHTVVLSAPPATVSVAECYTPMGSPSDCTAEIEPVHAYANRAAEAAVATLDDPSVTFANLDRAFCASQQCPAIIDTFIVRADEGHLTDAFARHLAPVVHEALED